MNLIENVKHCSGYHQEVTFAVVKRPVSGMMAGSFFPNQEFVNFAVPAELKVRFSDDSILSVKLSQETEVGSRKKVRLTYSVDYCGHAIGSIVTLEHILTKSDQPSKHGLANTLVWENGVYADYIGTTHRLIGELKNQLYSGMMVLSDLDFDNPIAVLEKMASQLYQVNDELNRPRSSTQPTRFGQKVCIRSFMYDDSGIRQYVSWGNGAMHIAGTSLNAFPVNGQLSFSQNLDSFLEMFPRHPKLLYTDKMRERDEVIFPKIRKFVDDDFAEAMEKMEAVKK